MMEGKTNVTRACIIYIEREEGSLSAGDVKARTWSES